MSAASRVVPSADVVPFYVHRHVVGLRDTNVVGNVYFSRYLDWQGTCREMFLRDHAREVLAELRGSLRLITLHCGCRYFSELFAFDEVEVRMRLSGLQQNRIAMEFEYRVIRDGEDVLAARGDQEIACMRAAGERLLACPIPEELSLALRPFTRSHT